MENTALYRKYRPKNFDEVIGQNHIVKTLKNQIKSADISHAYLFCGTRGTGKTSIAKIFAKAINCPHNTDGNPCNRCNICNDLSNSNNVDVFEIDAASNNGIDNIRELKEKVKYPPVIGKYKVYIIDEVHMLSDSAFNALLKTLEEPPKNVVFILATTEVQKIPATIISRCLKFDFRLIEIEELGDYLKKLFDKDNVNYEEAALKLIARMGEGSVRDTLSVADVCVAYTNKNVTYNSVIEALGTTNFNDLCELAEFVIKKDSKNLLNKVSQICTGGKNIPQVCKDLVNFIRDIVIVKTCDDFNKMLNYPSDMLNKIKTLAKFSTTNKLIELLEKLSGLEQEFRYTRNARALFEITLLSLSCTNELDELKTRINNLEKKGANSMGFTSIAMASKIISEKEISNEKKNIIGEFLNKLRNTKEIKLFAIITEYCFIKTENDYLILTTKDNISYEELKKEDNWKTLNEILKSIGYTLKVHLENQDNVVEKDIKEILKEEFKGLVKIV